MRYEEYAVTRNYVSIATFDAKGNLLVFADFIFLAVVIESSADRSAYAIFVEAAKDVSERLELRGAIRAENLETDDTINPKRTRRMEGKEKLV